MTNKYACPIRSECGWYGQNPDLPPGLNPVFRHGVCDGSNNSKTGLYTICVEYRHLAYQDDLGLDDFGLSAFPVDDDVDDGMGLTELLGDEF